MINFLTQGFKKFLDTITLQHIHNFGSKLTEVTGMSIIQLHTVYVYAVAKKIWQPTDGKINCVLRLTKLNFSRVVRRKVIVHYQETYRLFQAYL